MNSVLAPRTEQMRITSRSKHYILFLIVYLIARPSFAIEEVEYAKKLLSTNDAIRSQASHDLQQMSPRVRIPLIQPLIKEIKFQNNVYLRRCGVSALGLIGPDAPTEVQTNTVIPFLIDILLQQGSQQREDSYEARSALARFGKTAVPQLISKFSSHGIDNLISSTLEINVQNDNKEIVSELMQNLDNANANIRKGVARSIRFMNSNHTEYVPKLIKAFNSPPNRTLRSDIALIFVNLGSNAVLAAPSLIEGAQDKSDEYLRVLSVIALGQFGMDYPKSLPVLIKALYDTSCGVKTNAMEALVKIGTHEALSAVEQYKKSDRYCELGDV